MGRRRVYILCVLYVLYVGLVVRCEGLHWLWRLEFELLVANLKDYSLENPGDARKLQ